MSHLPKKAPMAAKHLPKQESPTFPIRPQALVALSFSHPPPVPGMGKASTTNLQPLK